MHPPERLVDPDGEGVYLRVGGNLRAAAHALFGDARRWAEVDARLVYLQRGSDDLWYPAKIGERSRGWRLNLPSRWRPVAYVYYTPDRDAQ